jgi:hypothetical protein
VCAFATLLGLGLASEARAADESSGDVAPAESSSGDVAPAVEPVTGDGSAQEPPAPESPPEQPAPDEATGETPSAEAPPPAPEAPPPAAEAPPPAAEAPPPAAEAPPPAPEAPPHRDSIVIIKRNASPVSLPSLFPSLADRLAATTGAGGRLAPQGGSRSQSGDEGTQAAGNARNAPLLPGLPFRGGAPSDLYVSAGGSSGSSGGFFPLVLGGRVGLLAAAAQRRGGLVPLALAPPRCAAFVRRLERPD